MLTLFLYGNINAQTSQQEALDQALGDLDGDGINEQVIIYNTGQNSSKGQLREIHIFKQAEEEWALSQRIAGGILTSEAGGTLGDPYQGMEIKDGKLILFHLGGNSNRWSYTHHFRLGKNSWELVYARAVYFRNCDYFHTIDFDLLSGTLLYKEEQDDCIEGSVMKVLLERKELVFTEQLPKLEGFVPGGYKLRIPGTSIEVLF